MTSFDDVRRISLALPELLEMDPATFAKSACVGRFGWTTVDFERVEPDLLVGSLRAAWRRTVPKRLVATLEDRA
ncbi:MAG: hypothetical protein ABIZ72_01865 [Candidatus Limnocylindrales bacterium]